MWNIVYNKKISNWRFIEQNYFLNFVNTLKSIYNKGLEIYFVFSLLYFHKNLKKDYFFCPLEWHYPLKKIIGMQMKTILFHSKLVSIEKTNIYTV